MLLSQTVSRSAPVTELSVHEIPAAVIKEYVRDQPADLLMMPTRGCGTFRRRLIGSVMAKLLHDLSIPVWTSVHTEEQDYGHLACQSILCAIDVGPHSVPLMQFACEFGAKCGSVVRLAYAIPVANLRSQEHLNIEFVADRKECARREIARLQREVGTNFEVCIEAGKVSEVIRCAAIHHAADLVVVSRGETAHLKGRLRRHAYAIVRESPCPVLSV
jgi:nucleotide-binding universal stress UspA family protein